MPRQEQDPFGSVNPTTEYEREGRPGGKAGAFRTKLAVGMAVGMLTVFLSWLYITPFDADPAPEGAAPVATRTNAP